MKWRKRLFIHQSCFFIVILLQKRGAPHRCVDPDILLEKLAERKPDLIEAFEERGVKYRTNMPAEDDPQSGLGRSWRSTLSVQTKPEAEARLSDLGYSWTWGDDDTLHATTPRLEAVQSLTDGRKVFFNQLIAAFRGWKDSRNDPSQSHYIQRWWIH